MDIRKYVLIMVVVLYVIHVAIQRFEEPMFRPYDYLFTGCIYGLLTAYLFINDYLIY
jgi:hypothetical protein